MRRISASVSMCFTVLALGGGVGACSSESTEGAGAAGMSSSGGSAASGGSGGSTSAGAGTANGGSATGVGGGRAGSAGVAGNPGDGSCIPENVTCVDEATAATCDAETGEIVTVNCAEDLKELGIDSTGCEGDATEGGCNGQPSDPICWDGALVFGICGQLTREEFLLTYIDCFQDTNGAKVPVQCVAPFLAASGSQADCEGAVAACAEEGGAGGAGGAGG